MPDSAQAAPPCESAASDPGAVLAAAGSGVFSLDAGERIAYANAAAGRLLGMEPQAMLGRDARDLLAPLRDDSGDAAVALLGPARRVLDVSFRRADGARFPVEFQANPILAADGAAAGAAIVFWDATESRRVRRQIEEANTELEANNTLLEETIERANQMALEAQVASATKSEFLANMSHEIRTPMNGVIGMTTLLLDTRLDESQRDCVDTIRRSGEALLAIINDILDFSKIEAGRLSLERIAFDPVKTIEETAEPLAEGAQGKGLEIILDLDPAIPARVMGDPTRLRQIVTNLLGNAAKFTMRGHVAARVRVISLDESGCELRFEVTDTGIGIDEAGRRRLFAPFSQADSSTTRKFGGTGLGLAISKQLAEAMGGKIGVDSVPGRGSTFWFTARFDIAPGEEGAAPADARLRGRRALVAAGDEALREALRRQIEALGMACECAESADDAALVLSTPGAAFDVCVLDAGPVAPRAAEGFKTVKAAGDAPVLLLTRFGQLGQRDRNAVAAAQAYVSKPVRRRLLALNLLRAMGLEETVIAEEAAAAPAADAGARLYKILLVEDNPVNQKVAGRMLEKLRCAVRTADNGVEALEIMQRENFDIVFMDCQMPERDGYETTRLFRRHEARVGGHMPVVAMTANAMQGDREVCLDAGMDDYITKPIDTARLAEMVEKWGRAGETPRGEGAAPTIDRQTAIEALEGEHDFYDIDDDEIEVVEEPGARVVPFVPVQTAAPVVAVVMDNAPPALDPGVFADLVALGGDDPGFVLELLDQFALDAAAHVAGIVAGQAAGDAKAVEHAAHTLKSSSGNLGGKSVSELCAKLQAQGRAGDLSQTAPLVAGLQSEFTRLMTAIEKEKAAL